VEPYSIEFYVASSIAHNPYPYQELEEGLIIKA